jgi:hypothetical protein
VVPLSGFYKWSEYSKLRFRHYKMNNQLTLDNVSAPTINFMDHRKLLLEKDFNMERVLFEDYL